MAEWSKALAWKVSIRQNRIEGSNPSVSAISPQSLPIFVLAKWSLYHCGDNLGGMFQGRS